MAIRSCAKKALPLAPHTCSQSTVTQRKNNGLLAVFMFIGSRVQPPPPSPPNKNFFGGERSLPHALVPKNSFTNVHVFNNTCDISDFTAHIFCPQTTQELPKKHNEVGPPEQLPTDALAQINNYYGHTRHCEELLVPTSNAKGIVGVCMWLSGR